MTEITRLLDEAQMEEFVNTYPQIIEGVDA